jgi:hypothetical protein
LDLRLLQRHALFLGAQLAIVAPSADIRQSARELGIPIFKTAAIAQRRTWQAKRILLKRRFDEHLPPTCGACSAKLFLPKGVGGI